MVVAIVHNVRLPVKGYGGTERVIWWLAKGLSELGHQVTLIAAPGTVCPFATVLHADFSKPLEFQVPAAQVFHFFETPKYHPEKPYLVTIEGNGQAGENFLPNTVFVSKNHAERHGSKIFVHNGLDPADYRYFEKKHDFLLFLAKAKWKVKNVRGAIEIAHASKRPLHIAGGSRRWLPSWRGVHWLGDLGAERKVGELALARALLFPVLWPEPFGIAVIEALVSGTPVIASPFGSLPELVPKSVGFICREKQEFLDAVEQVGAIESIACRSWVIENFHYHIMCRRYHELYARVFAGETLNPIAPRGQAWNPSKLW